jgi:hypothetical protein
MKKVMHVLSLLSFMAVGIIITTLALITIRIREKADSLQEGYTRYYRKGTLHLAKTTTGEEAPLQGGLPEWAISELEKRESASIILLSSEGMMNWEDTFPDMVSVASDYLNQERKKQQDDDDNEQVANAW